MFSNQFWLLESRSCSVAAGRALGTLLSSCSTCAPQMLWGSCPCTRAVCKEIFALWHPC